MASLQSLLRRRNEADEVEFELVRTKTLSRLTALSNGDPGTAEEEDTAVATTDAGEPDPAASGEASAGALAGALVLPAPSDATANAANASVAPAADVEASTPDHDGSMDSGSELVPVMAEPSESSPTSWEHIVWTGPDGTPATNGAEPTDAEPAAAVTSTTLTFGPRAVPSSIWDAESRASVAAADAAEAEPVMIRAPKAAPRVAAKKAPAAAVATVASCPYCALLLEPPPETSRRCTRCRQRIIVKRVEGRAVYLTEASLLVFSAQRRRNANLGRWTRDRERWLKGASAVGAPEARIARLAIAPLTEDTVRFAQTLYMTTVEKSYRAAKREHRWEDASRIKRDQAMLLFRFAGSPTPPPEDIVHLHREGAVAALRGIGEMAKDAQLVNATCCGVCRADAGRAFRITHELRVPRLPHAGCPKGLCRCDWDLAIRDRDMVRRYLRRRPRADQALVSIGSAPESGYAPEDEDAATEA